MADLATAHAAPAEPVAMTPGTYLRLRREAAGLSIEAVAMTIVSSPVGLPAAIAAIEAAEADRECFAWADVHRLTRAFRFDPSIYAALVEGLSFPPLCRVCACSWDDPCDDDGQGCAWADPSQTLCTVCGRAS